LEGRGKVTKKRVGTVWFVGKPGTKGFGHSQMDTEGGLGEEGSKKQVLANPNRSQKRMAKDMPASKKKNTPD